MFNSYLLKEVSEILKNIKWIIAVAESVTAGLIQAAFSTVKDASHFFQGGITAYNIGQKCRHLLVEPLHALECDSVSLKVAEDMSKQACTMFTSTFGLGITGYAATVPEKNINKLFAYYGIAKESELIDSGKIYSEKEEGLNAQLDFVNQVLYKLQKAIV